MDYSSGSQIGERGLYSNFWAVGLVQSVNTLYCSINCIQVLLTFLYTFSSLVWSSAGYCDLRCAQKNGVIASVSPLEHLASLTNPSFASQ